MLHARRLNLLRKCVAECDAATASPPVPPSRWSSSSGSADSLLDDACEHPHDVTMTTPPSPQGVWQCVDTGDFASASLDSGSSHWATPDGLVPPERLYLVHAGALAIEDLIPPHPYALASAGWRQIGDLYMAVVASKQARARPAKFGSLADTDSSHRARELAAHMYRVADEVQPEPQLYAPVPVRARRPGEPSALEWLHEVAELRLEYLELCRTTEGPCVSLRARSVQEGLEMMEYWYRIHRTGDSSWSPRF
ncbi:hypothetical protein AURDEDRAFT_114484 [Auricularia subglabra TFB-10046 SS5]|nr:hypothetical protein AURDEDRAFT_114484 [Auricularia subglabra TFB-10046 SS5]